MFSRDAQDQLQGFFRPILRHKNPLIESRSFRWGCGLLIAACLVVRALDGVYYFWNDVRFSRAYALAHGYDLYTPPDSGVIPGIIYGPVGFFLYAPAALWPAPAAALLSACLVSALATLGPAGLVLADRRIAGEPGPWVLPIFTVVLLHFYWSAATVGVWMVHTDAAALGLSCLALYWTLRHPPEKTLSWQLFAAAATASLAVWAKQTTAPILLIPCAYFLLRRARRSAAWVLLLSAAFAAVLGAIFSALYGFRDLWLAMFEVPSGRARYPGIVLHEGGRITDFMEMMYLLAIVVVCSIVSGKRLQPAAGACSRSRPRFLAALFSRISDWTAWPLFLGAGLALLPMSLLGRMKAGGAANNFGLADYFLSLGIALLFLRLSSRPELQQSDSRRALQAAVVLLLAVMGLRTVADLTAKLHPIALHWPPSAQIAYSYARKNPGSTYFPWHPLASLMAEGRYYHTSWGVMEREAGGYPVSEAHFRAHLPENLQRIAAIDDAPLVSAIKSADWGHYLLRRLPELRCEARAPGLPGWAVLERGPEHCQAPGTPGVASNQHR